jgi:hypothetical protein
MNVASHLELNSYALQYIQVWANSVSNKGHFTFMRERFFVPITPRILAERLKHHT